MNQQNTNFCPFLDNFTGYCGKHEFQEVFRGFGLLTAVSQYFHETKIYVCMSIVMHNGGI